MDWIPRVISFKVVVVWASNDLLLQKALHRPDLAAAIKKLDKLACIMTTDTFSYNLQYPIVKRLNILLRKENVSLTSKIE